MKKYEIDDSFIMDYEQGVLELFLDTKLTFSFCLPRTVEHASVLSRVDEGGQKRNSFDDNEAVGTFR